jgi:hypothetical protein
MIGTLLNSATVLIGGSLGLIMGRRIPDKSIKTVIAGLGLFTLAYGLNLFLDSQNVIITLLSLLVGGLIGEWADIEFRLEKFGGSLKKRFADNRAENEQNFVNGFLTASLVFCIGPLTILGSIQDGLEGDYSLLAIKSVLDGFAALAFASTMGIGVLFSIIVILIYQGTLTFLAAQIQAFVTDQMIAEMTAVGGVLLVGIAISSLLEIKPIRVGNFLPALFLAPLLVRLFANII